MPRVPSGFRRPIHGINVLVLVDAHSKWMDVHLMQTIMSAKTIEKLLIIFANHGIPHKVITDNGPTFTSYEFQEFMQKNGIVHVKSAPYHPSSNGLAERAVQTLKRVSGTTLQERVSKFLFKYRLTPHSVTGVAPSKLLFGRRIRCRLDSWFPDASHRVESQQQKQKQPHDSTTPLRFMLVIQCMLRISLGHHQSGCKALLSKLQDLHLTMWSWSPDTLFIDMWTHFV